LSRLAADRDPRAAKAAADWVSSDEGVLREAGVAVSLTLREPGAVSRALEFLKRDPDPAVRGAAAMALGTYVRLSELSGAAVRERSAVVMGLASAVSDDDDRIVQRACYEALVQTLRDPLESIPLDFDPTVHVDWKWIRRLTTTG
jgi:hypothetical protein